MLTVKKVLNILNDIAPMEMAEDYDNVGLLVGDANREVTKIMCVLDLTKEIVDDAIEKKVDLIVSHHPLIFKGMKKITTKDYKGEIIGKLFKHDISYIAMHTNFDKAKDCLNDYLAELLDMKNVEVLDVDSKLYSVCFYTPKIAVEMVKEELFKVGAGKFKAYSKCCYDINGKGQFLPNDTANPYIGEPNVMEYVDEVKTELVCDEYEIPKVLETLREFHPYEEVSYTITENKIPGKNGFGRIGEVEEMDLIDFCKLVKERLNLVSLKFTGNPYDKVSKVALCTGAGGDMYYTAMAKGANVYITGDVKHNVSVEASQYGTSIIDAGHYGTEVIFKKICKNHLQQKINELQYNVYVIESDAEKSAWKYV